jgi:hypothetical protein
MAMVARLGCRGAGGDAERDDEAQHGRKQSLAFHAVLFGG